MASRTVHVFSGEELSGLLAALDDPVAAVSIAALRALVRLPVDPAVRAELEPHCSSLERSAWAWSTWIPDEATRKTIGALLDSAAEAEVGLARRLATTARSSIIRRFAQLALDEEPDPLFHEMLAGAQELSAEVHRHGRTVLPDVAEIFDAYRVFLPRAGRFWFSWVEQQRWSYDAEHALPSSFPMHEGPLAATRQLEWIASRVGLETLLAGLQAPLQQGSTCDRFAAAQLIEWARRAENESHYPRFGGGAGPGDVPISAEGPRPVPAPRGPAAAPVPQPSPVPPLAKGRSPWRLRIGLGALGGLLRRRPSSKRRTSTAVPKAPAPPDDRRLQTLVCCPPEPGAEKAVTDHFVPGVEHDIQVCIAAKLVSGAVAANEVFDSPTPGQNVDLDVSIIVGGKRSRRSLMLPAFGDSDLTEPVSFTVPADAAHFAVYVEVAYQKRVIQSACLKGAPFELSVDVNEPAQTVEDRPAADGSITIVDGPSGEPAVIDLDVEVGDVGEKQIVQATKGLRRELHAAFLNPPGSLAEASEALTRLAVRGRILYDRLAAGAAGYHDNDAWIHVNAFSKSDVPIELVYTHPMPANDTDVPVCPEALAGAAGCDRDCPSRNRADVVCPYGFWATSKIIERRRHVPGRTNATPGQYRQLTPMSSSVVGISVKADEVDASSSTRIKTALASTVTSPEIADSWQTLDSVAKTHPRLVVLVTHTIGPPDPDGDELSTELELNGDVRRIHRINDASVNPGCREPGPVVLALGCDTNTLTAGFTDLVVNLHNARAEIVLSALSPIPGKGVADFLERFLPLLKAQLQQSGQHRFGAVMLAARRETIANGDLMALALTATGDADVELTI